MSPVLVITTADSEGAPQRQLACGCWQAFVRGDVVTAKCKDWVTILACAEHANPDDR